MRKIIKASRGAKLSVPPFSRNRMNPEHLKEKIQRTAQEIYERRGCEPGHELEDWLEAERQVKKELSLT